MSEKLAEREILIKKGFAQKAADFLIGWSCQRQTIKVEIENIYLFGSVAQSDATQESDIDLAVLLKRGTLKKFSLELNSLASQSVNYRKRVLGIGMLENIDVTFFDPEWFEGGNLQHQHTNVINAYEAVLREGIRLR